MSRRPVGHPPTHRLVVVARVEAICALYADDPTLSPSAVAAEVGGRRQDSLRLAVAVRRAMDAATVSTDERRFPNPHEVPTDAGSAS